MDDTVPARRAGRGQTDLPLDAVANTPEKPRLFPGCP